MTDPGIRVDDGSTPDQGRVFVSHTAELDWWPQPKSYVQAGLNAITAAGLVGVDMRYFAAQDRPPARVCEDAVRSCGVYVVVVGFRYGSIVPGRDVSHTELEFDVATAARIPRIVALLRNKPDDGSLVDDDPARIDRFRYRLSNEAGLTVAMVDNADQLELAITHGLTHLRAGRTGSPSYHRLSAGPAASSSLPEYLRQQVKHYHGQDWTRHALALEVRDGRGIRSTVDAALAEWVHAQPSKLLFLVGDFGSGKTWTLRRFACELSEQRLQGARSPVPVYVNLERLAMSGAPGRDEVLAAATPLGLSVDALHGEPVVLILDGLDELVRPASATRVDVVGLLRSVLSAEPGSTRFVLGCRNQTIDLDALTDRLGAALADRDGDPTRWAVAQALGSGSPSSRTLTLLDVPAAQADEFLGHTRVHDLWQSVRSQPAYRDLARLPFTIYLLQEALPVLVQSGAGPDLAVLYDAAAESWLRRGGYYAERLDGALRRLESHAVSWLHGREVALRPDDRPLLHAGILATRPDGRAAFPHYSMGEYFLAKVLARELRTYSSALLSRLNLIYMYNVNRFLVPTLLREFDAPLSRSANDGVLEVVSTQSFQRFMAATGWRREGFGWWGSLAAPDGTHPYEGEDPSGITNILNDGPQWSDQSHPATGLSWYDAFEYCRWAGGRLPTEKELATRPLSALGVTRMWTASWHRELAAQMAVVRTASDEAADPPHAQVEGLNPDVRLPDVAFCLARDARTGHPD